VCVWGGGGGKNMIFRHLVGEAGCIPAPLLLCIVTEREREGGQRNHEEDWLEDSEEGEKYCRKQVRAGKDEGSRHLIAMPLGREGGGGGERERKLRGGGGEGCVGTMAE
jgi:hypothetical protein